MAPLFAIAGLLLLSELSEVSIPGILSLKRRVEEQAEDLRTQSEELRVLTEQVQQVTVSAAQNTNIFIDPALAAEAARQKLGDGDPPSSAEPASSGPTPEDAGVPAPEVPRADATPEAEIALLERRVLHQYARLEPYVMIRVQADGEPRVGGPAAWREVAASLTSADLDALRRWQARWTKEITLVRSVRNSIAHPPAVISRNDLRAVLEVLEVLNTDLEQKLALERRER